MKDTIEGMDLGHILAVGGMSRRPPGEEGGDRSEVTRYRYGRDPAAADRLGRALAQKIDGPIEVVVTWEDADTALAHVLGRELGASHTVAFDEGGLAFLSEEIAPSVRVAIAADAFRKASVVRTLVGLVEAAGSEVVAACSLVESAALTGLASSVARHWLVREAELDLSIEEA